MAHDQREPAQAHGKCRPKKARKRRLNFYSYRMGLFMRVGFIPEPEDYIRHQGQGIHGERVCVLGGGWVAFMAVTR